MNLILLFPEDFTGAGEVRLHDRRLTHITEVHRAEVGDCLKVGMINGAVGQGKVIAIDQQEAVLRVNLTREPPAALPLTLIMALPRPKMFKKNF